jgi:hypothetical protein
MENQPGQSQKKNSNVIYFLIAVVVALVRHRCVPVHAKKQIGYEDSLPERRENPPANRIG